MKENTPMIKQYLSIKDKYPDCILFFRLGDFYEMFFADAKIASSVLDLTLTARAKNSENPIPMCGIPHHSSENYILKLNESGHKVAICEQVEQSVDSKIVERKVVKVLTPATNLECENINESLNLVCINQENNKFNFAYTCLFSDTISTKENLNLSQLLELIVKYKPKEILASEETLSIPLIYKQSENLNIKSTTLDFKLIRSSEKLDYLKDFFTIQKLENICNLSLNSYENIFEILNYLENLEGGLSKKIKNFSRIQKDDVFELNMHAIKNLEIFYTQMDFSKNNSLYTVINRTQTAMGRRLLRTRLLHPYKTKKILEQEYQYVENFLNSNIKELQSSLRKVIDLDKIESLIRTKNANPQSLCSLYDCLESLIEIINLSDHELIQNLKTNETKIIELRNLLNNLNLETPPKIISQGYIFKESASLELTELRNLLENSKVFLDEILEEEKSKTNIPNLKIKFNKVFGYFLEVSKGKTDMVPDYYIRKQTLTNAERYITPKLKELEVKILEAESKLYNLEQAMYFKLIENLQDFLPLIADLSHKIARLDLSLSFAKLTLEFNLSKPEIQNSNSLEILDGRHIVIENQIKDKFIKNNLELNHNTKSILITGPNMGGKSTFLRQNAIIVLMAQIGCFAPCSQLKFSLCDQIFVRVGSNDNLSAGESTFMVEMNETAAILKQATKDSLIILDEIGRGTATLDGLSLATAIFKHIHYKIKSKLLFATHYHELIETIENIKFAKNTHVGIHMDQNQNPVFLYKIKDGGMPKSFGIEVAKLAGLPIEVIQESQKLLNQNKKKQFNNQSSLFETTQEIIQPKEIERPKGEIKIINKLNELDINKLSPIQALLELEDLKSKLTD
ncbi:DNA mismatch repair protein MutS [bacterium]|nr:DNA mismatch repair protein MutS [bacterium]|tara:strand:- start:4276 stop:6840 length:2565 start_codon:yes stop_codon:yes gene_type:complete